MRGRKRQVLRDAIRDQRRWAVSSSENGMERQPTGGMPGGFRTRPKRWYGPRERTDGRILERDTKGGEIE
jgi:hypothetical protein